MTPDAFFTNKALIVPAVAWLVAQTLKVLIYLVKDKKLNLTYLVDMGRMPSAHTALTCSLATIIAKLQGLGSPVFAVSLFFALVVMYDAAGVRQTVSQQSAILNRMLDELLQGHTDFEQRLREFIGHTKLEVIAGALLGVAVALLWP